MVVMQELSDHDMANRSMVVEHLTRILLDDAIILMTDEAHFTYLAVSTNRISTIGERKIHSSSLSGLFMVHV
jgi:hypothetical protein